jgi:hypothetical protein
MSTLVNLYEESLFFRCYEDKLKSQSYLASESYDPVMPEQDLITVLSHPKGISCSK